ncbi:hypothetical protein Tco_0324386 [Tanacetum coccineum]
MGRSLHHQMLSLVDTQQRMPRRSWKKHKERWDFTLLTLLKEAQVVSITDCQAGNPCELISDPTVENELQLVRAVITGDYFGLGCTNSVGCADDVVVKRGYCRNGSENSQTIRTKLDTFYNALNANDQDSLNSAAGGNFLDKMPRECLRIIENVAALTTEVSELKNLMKTMLIDKQKAQAPATVKVVEQSCVTCGGAHSYKNCPATDGNVYQDNIQEYVSQAAAANFNQGNTNSRPPMVSNQIRPPGFPPIQNNQNRFNPNQGNNFNQNRGTNFNQNRGSNFNQGQVYQPPTNQPPVYQAPPQQMQGVSKTNFENYVKANDVVLRNMQNQGQGLQNQMTNLTEMLSKFITSNTASSSNSGTLPSQTVTNPHEHVNAITTRSGKNCEGPSTPLVPTPIVSI